MIRKWKREAVIRKGTKMSVVITNGELPQLAEALAALGKEKFGVTFSFKIKRAIAAIKPALETYSEMRNEIIEEFARRDKDGNKVTTADGAVVEMNEGWFPKMKELNSLEAVRLAPLSAKELVAACEAIDCGISGQMLADLGSLLTDDLEGVHEPEPAVQTIAPRVLNGSKEPLPEVAL